MTGWFVLRYGGFYTSHKYSQITTFVDGLGAIFMAYLFFLLATVALAVVLQSFAVRRNAYVASGLLMLQLRSIAHEGSLLVIACIESCYASSNQSD